MNISDIVSFWKSDAQDEPERAEREEPEQIPQHPVGQIELTDEELKDVVGGGGSIGGGVFTSGTSKLVNGLAD